MSAFTYNTITAALLIGIVTAFVVMVVSLIAMIVRWKQPSWRKHVIRLFVAIAAIPCLIGIQQSILWLVFLPSLGRQQMALVNPAREETNESVRGYRDKNGFSFPIAADPDRAVYSLFAKETIPRTVVVSPDGRIVYSKAGFYEDDLDSLKAVLREQLASVK